MRVGESTNGYAITARMVRRRPIDRRATTRTEVKTELAAFDLALIDGRGAREAYVRRLIVSTNAERGTRPALAFDTIAQRHNGRFAIGFRRQ